VTAGTIHALRFGAYELDLRAAELRRAGVLIKLAPQQFRLLRFLAERTGQICTRDQLRADLWDAGTFVDFDRGLTVAIAAIRGALNDDSDSPRYIQTVPRQGYRFVAPVEPISADPPIAPRPTAKPHWRRTEFRLAAGFVLAAVVATVLGVLLSSGPTMLAVLPFENLTQRSEDAPLLSGLTDEILTQLGAIDPERLGVIGRTSVTRYVAGKSSLPQIRRDLGVEYLVEGSLRVEGDTLRITVRLLKAATQSQLWSRTFQTGAGALETEQDVAAQSAVEIGALLFPPNRPAHPSTHTPPAAAREAYLNGRYMLQTRGRRAIVDALQQFNLASERDPAWAEAWTAVAEAHLGRALGGGSALDAFDQARTAAARALRLDEHLAEAHDALGNVLFWRDWNWRESRRHFDRAIELNASLARAHHDRALLDIVTGQPERGVSGLRRAIALDPLSPHVNIDAGWLFLQAHHFAEAERAARRALELEPTLEEAKACIARAQLYGGRPAAGMVDKLREAAESSGNPWYRALASAATGGKDQALAALDEAFAKHSSMMVMLKTEPAFTVLHSDPHFQELVRKVGL
jgi:DNA-binding winged helix-turn-helix (wHTH) protein/TolB-like protein/Tfp pilus assembly protein PilF